MKIAGLALGFELVGTRLAPHDSRAAVCAGACCRRDRIVHRAPTKRSHGVESRLEHDAWRAVAPAVDLHMAAADVDDTPLRGKLPRRAPAHNLFVAHARQHGGDDKASDDEGDSFDPSQHMFTSFFSAPRRPKPAPCYA